MFKWLFVVVMLCVSFYTQASVIVLGTRVIYPSHQKNVQIKVLNKGGRPSLVQTWFDNGDEKADPKTIKLPFVITPPVVRLDAKKEQIFNISYTGEPLATDRETLFFFNVLDIPPKPSQAELAKNPNYLQFSVRSRLKFFFRPTNLPYTVTDAYQKVQWHVKGKKITVQNPTPYFITYGDVSVMYKGKAVKASNADMVAPFSSAVFDLTSAVNGGEVKWSVVNDYGGETKGSSQLK